jgi:outer membrane protein
VFAITTNNNSKYNLKNSTGFTPYIGVGGSAFLLGMNKGLADDVKNTYGFAGQLGFNFKPADAKTGVFSLMRVMQILAQKLKLMELSLI